MLSVGANGCGGAGLAEMDDAEQIARWVDDTVDLIEFANGGTDTEWGAKRAALGHPKPFDMKMIGLGNEENTTTFEANFPEFRDAIKAKYPDMQIISNSGPFASGSRFDTLWDFNRAQKVDMVDEHYYQDPNWFLANNHRYDTYDRSGPKVFLGEYASRGNTFANALSEASYMTALQRNADVVRLASYAPLLANESNVQWTPDAIWFDNDESWSSANWEVQKMFGNNVGDEVVPSTFDGAVNQPDDISGGVFLSTWSTAGVVRQPHGEVQRQRRHAVLRHVRRRVQVVAAVRHLGGDGRQVRADVDLGQRRAQHRHRCVRQGLEQLHARARRHQAGRRRGLPRRLRREGHQRLLLVEHRRLEQHPLGPPEGVRRCGEPRSRRSRTRAS